jgi:4-aminobutyrate aminotransferase-like enzyme
VIRMLPPLNIPRDTLDQALDILALAVATAARA